MAKPNWEFPPKLEFLFQPARYKVAHGGRGGTKSWGFARALLYLTWRTPLRILCAREIQKSIKDSVHKLLSDQIQRMGLGAHFEVLQNEIRGTNGSEFLFTGLSKETAESIKSYEGIDICWVEEAHKVTRRSWDILTPTIRNEVWRVYGPKGGFIAGFTKDQKFAAELKATECNGKAVFEQSEVWISLNPELDTDETFVRFIENPPLDAVVVEINWRDNEWFPAVLEKERQELLRQVEIGTRSQDDYDHIWEGNCKAALEGSIYAKEVIAAKVKGRLCNVPHDPLLKVHTIWDLGWADSMSILMVQKQASEIRVIDYIEGDHRTYDSYVNGDPEHPEFDYLAKKNYRWAKDWLPHDGKAKSPESGRSPEMILGDLGRTVEIVDDIGLENGIKAARLLFPRVYFDREKAGLLFNHLGRYKRRINQSTNQPGSPEHNEDSHGADGFRYLGVCADQMANDDTPIADDPYAGFKNRVWAG